MENRSINREGLILLSIPGLLGLILPFAYGLSPLSVMLGSIGISFRESVEIAGPFFLAVVIFAWQILRLYRPKSSPVEALLAVICGLASLPLPIELLLDVIKEGYVHVLNRGNAFSLVLLCFSFASLILGVWCFIKQTTRHLAPDVFLLAAYLPHATFWLLGIFLDSRLWLQAGAYMVLLACICYVVSIVILLRSVLKKESQ